VVREAERLGVKALTIFAFSTENWNRPSREVQTLWNLFVKYLHKEGEELHRENVRLRMFGELERLDPEVKASMDPVLALTRENTGLQLNVAISYGSRAELARAARLFAEDCVKGLRSPSEMSEELLWQYLWTHDLGDLASVDLVIRTSGERRVSNFLLWQSAYAEYSFQDVCWPDFRPEHLKQSVEEFMLRERRFGRVGPRPPEMPLHS
jgi:undecaprenyl diphosphate synthase